MTKQSEYPNLDSPTEIYRRELTELKIELDRLKSSLQAQAAAHEAQTESVRKQFGVLTRRVAQIEHGSVGMDIASVARQLRPLLVSSREQTSIDERIGAEHGHALLIAMMVEEELTDPGILAGKRLVEVGSTRELWLDQRSTQKLSFFCLMMSMDFISVDMDKENVTRLMKTLPYLSPGSEIIHDRGEDFLDDFSEKIDYLYLDAFDFDHGRHSKKRMESYQSNLDTTINDEDCWRMHLDCAANALPNLSENALVVFDDSWEDSLGELHGKGKLAIPFLLEHGFREIKRTRTTICLRRTQ